MPEVVKQHKDGWASVVESGATALPPNATEGESNDAAESRPETRGSQSRPLSDEERRARLERETARMADPAYSRTLEDPTEAIEGLLRHHGRR